MFTAALKILIICKKWKQTKHPTTNEQIKCSIYIQTMEYQAIKKVLIHATIWMKSENITYVKEGGHKEPHIK